MSFPTKIAAPTALTLLQSYMQTDVTGQTIDIVGLDITPYKAFLLLINYLEGHAAGSSEINLYFNEDYTDSHYYSQRIHAYGTSTVTGLGSEEARLQLIGFRRARMLLEVGINPEGHAQCQASIGSLVNFVVGITRRTGVEMVCIAKKDATVENITSIRITGTYADSIGIGTTIDVYGLS